MMQESNIWHSLERHYRFMGNRHMRELFAEQAGRFERFSLKQGGIFLDYSKNRITQDTLDLLFALLREREVESWRDRMFAGEKINFTENRAVLHTALRQQSDEAVMVDGHNVIPDIRSVLNRIEAFSDRVRSGEWKGYTGKRITDIINLGIGGSDLGPKTVVEALKPYAHEEITTHFVSNIDASHIAEALKLIDPETCLFIIASKSFTTEETMTNAATARQWFLDRVGDETAIAKHFVAISTNTEAVDAFGIDTDNMFGFWDWVGGRYSVWSAIGLPIALSVGMDNFRAFLKGGWEMDQHFRTAEPEQNMPMIMAMIGVWYNNFCGSETHAVMPYDQYLRYLPMHLQQVDMESNGKRITRDGRQVTWDTGPVIWGEAGANGQHSFYQLLHQGTHLISADFILPMQSYNPIGTHHDRLVANCIAQTEALVRGRTAEEARVEMEQEGYSGDELEALLLHKVFPGNFPTNSLLIDKLTPENLGALIALYEHKVFVQGIIWGVNSFDQWGVELGKKLATRIENEISQGEDVSGHGQSTNGLINYYLKYRKS
jgi:glucose-6-phosphate isomerase